MHLSEKFREQKESEQRNFRDTIADENRNSLEKKIQEESSHKQKFKLFF